MSIQLMSRHSALLRLMEAQNQSSGGLGSPVVVRMNGEELTGAAGLERARSLIRSRTISEFQLKTTRAGFETIVVNPYGRNDLSYC